MERDYIEFNGRKYRFECNWRAIQNFLQDTGNDTMQGISNLKELNPSMWAPLLAACINEGEALDGKDTHFTKDDFMQLRDVSVFKDFLNLYIKQSAPQTKNEAVAKKD